MAVHKKILHIAETLRGGPASYLNYVATPFSHLAPNVATVVLGPNCHSSDLDPAKFFRTYEFAKQGRGISASISLALHTIRVVNLERPDVIVLHGTGAAAVCRPLLAVMGYAARTVYVVHCWSFNRPVPRAYARLLALMERALSLATSQIICVSKAQYELAVSNRLPTRKLNLVYNGIPDKRVPVRSNWQNDASKLRALFVGRLDKQKGIDILLEAGAELELEIALRIAGEPVVGSFPHSRLPCNTEKLGWVSPIDLERELMECDVVVMPSRWESFGLVAAEAMRASKPVVASNVGGLNEVVEDGVTGLLFSPVTASNLVSALRRVKLMDLVTLGYQGRKRFERLFTADLCAEGLMHVCRKVEPNL